jgi:hypothetical protein
MAGKVYAMPQERAVLGHGEKPRECEARTATQICSSGLQWSAVPLFRRSQLPYVAWNERSIWSPPQYGPLESVQLPS